MKHVGEAFAARLAADETTLCVCWMFTRRDGAVFGATDHDVPLTLDGVTCAPAAGLELVTFESSAGLAPGRASASGALSLDFISAKDVDGGLWDGAHVQAWRVDWRAPEHRVHLWSGRLSEITRQGDAFSAELVSLKADLEKTIGRVYARACDADVGDARCGVDLDDAAFRTEGVVERVEGARTFVAAALASFPGGWFTHGVLAWLTGGNVSATVRVMRHAGDAIELLSPPGRGIEAGDAFVVTAGCDKSFAMCGARFANRINFRGFPHMPGADVVLAGPAADRVNDGGRR